MGSDRCSNFIARSRNCSGVSIYPEGGGLTGLGAAVRTVARTAKPVAVVEDHRLVADRAVRRLFPRHAAQDVEVQLIIKFVGQENSLSVRRPDAKRFLRALARRHADEFQFWDLGEQWKKIAGLPFVYALWLIRPEVVDAKSVAQRLRALRDENLTNLDDLISDSVAGGVEPDSRRMTEFLTQYYSVHLRFSFGEAEKQGLEHFAHLCVRHGVLPRRDRTFTLV